MEADVSLLRAASLRKEIAGVPITQGAVLMAVQALRMGLEGQWFATILPLLGGWRGLLFRVRGWLAYAG